MRQLQELQIRTVRNIEFCDVACLMFFLPLNFSAPNRKFGFCWFGIEVFSWFVLHKIDHIVW